MRRSSPTVESVDVAKDWEATVLPLSEVMVPPAPPASVPQVNVPLAQRSFSVEALQAESDAPKREASVRPPVEEALRNERAPVVRESEVREVAVVVARVEVPCTLKSAVVVKLVEDAFVVVRVGILAVVRVAPVALRLVVEALVMVAFVAVRALMNAEVRVAPVADRLVVLALVAVRALMNPLVKVSPVPERLVVDALVE